MIYYIDIYIYILNFFHVLASDVCVSQSTHLIPGSVYCYTLAAGRDAAQCKQMTGAVVSGGRKERLLRACEIAYTSQSVGLSSVRVRNGAVAISRRYAAGDKAHYPAPQCQQLPEQLVGKWWTHSEAVRPAAKFANPRASARLCSLPSEHNLSLMTIRAFANQRRTANQSWR